MANVTGTISHYGFETKAYVAANCPQCRNLPEAVRLGH